MAFYDKFPYTNFQELNLDWITQEVSKVRDNRDASDASAAAALASEKAAKASETAAAASQQAAAGSETAAAASQQAAAGSEAASAEYLAQIGTHTAGAAADWLRENLTPTTPPVDASLTVAGAAADAKKTGDAVSGLNNDLTLFKGGKYELLKGNFVNGSLKAGELVPVGYRVAETEIISYDRDITLNIASGYKVGVHFFINGSFSYDSGWITGTYYIAAGTTFKIVIVKTTEDTSSTADVLEFRSAVTFTSVIDDITKKAEQLAWTMDDIKNVLTWQVGGLTPSGNVNDTQTWRLRTTLSVVPYDITITKENGFQFRVITFDDASMTNPVQSDWYTIVGATFEISAGTYFKILALWTGHDSVTYAIDDIAASFVFNAVHIYKTGCACKAEQKAEQLAWTIDDIKNVLTWQVGGLTPSGEVNNYQTWRLRTTLLVVPYDITITKENGFQFRVITFDDASMTNPVQSDWYTTDGATFEISAGTYFKIIALWTGHDSIDYAIDDIATSFVFNAVHIYKTGYARLANQNQKKIDAIKTFNPCFVSVSHQGYSTTGQDVGHNKISSYIGSFKHGFDTAETDIQFSSDGVPVCCHDASFVDSNDSSITVLIADHTVAELKTYGYYGETIATLAEVVETCKMYGLKLELDKIDASGNWTDSQWQSIFNAVATYQMQDHVIWTCPWRSNVIVNRILAYNPKAKIMFNINTDISLLDQYIDWIPTVMTDRSEFIFAVNYSIMTVEQLKEYNLRLPKRTNILVWTIDDPSVYRDYMPYAWGITSNKLCAKDIMF